MNTRILSVFSLLKRVGFAVLLLGASFLSHLNAAPLTVNAPSNTYFIANEGQWEGDFQFKCEVGSTVYYVTPKGMTVDFREFKRYPKPRDPGNPMDIMDRHEDRDSVTVRGHVVQIHYVEGNTRSSSVGEGKLNHYSNYFLGRDSTQWRSRVGHYQNIIVPEVWPGIDIEYRADQLGVETVYHVKPGADPAQIQMEYLGLDAPLRIDAQGNLVLTTSLGDVKEKAPFAFQQDFRSQQRVHAGYYVSGGNSMKFALGQYDPNRILTIDPLIYSTRWGGGGWSDGVALVGETSEHNIVSTGNTIGGELPTTPGAYSDEQGGSSDGYVTVFTPDGHDLVFSTYVGYDNGGQNNETLGGGVVDAQNRIWLSGYAGGPGWPITPNAFDTTAEGENEGIIVCLSAQGDSLAYCSYAGGSDWDVTFGVASDDSGIYVVGLSGSVDLPFTEDALDIVHDPVINESFLIRLDPTDFSLRYLSFGGSFGPERITLRATGTYWITGLTDGEDLSEPLPVTPDAFEPENPPGTDGCLLLYNFLEPSVEYCSYVGWEGDDYLRGISMLHPDTLLIFGYMLYSVDGFPVSPWAFDTIGQVANGNEGYLFTLALPSTVVDATFVGGTGFVDRIMGAFRDVDQTYWAYGSTWSDDLPTTPDAISQEFHGTNFDEIFLMRLNGSFSTLLYGTYIGTPNHDNLTTHLYVSPKKVWLAGWSFSGSFPTTSDAIMPSGSPGVLLRFDTVEPDSCDSLHIRDLVISTEGNDVILNWTLDIDLVPPECLTYRIRYFVYKAPDLTTEPTIVGITNSNSFVDINGISQAKAFYWVSAVH